MSRNQVIFIYVHNESGEMMFCNDILPGFSTGGRENPIPSKSL